MSAVALESPVGAQKRLRHVPRPVVAAERLEQPEVAAIRGVEPWELHSELALVCPEVRGPALELLPERDPDAFLAPLSKPIALSAAASGSLPLALFGYTLLRLLETAWCGLVAVGAVVALALLADAVH